MNNMEGSETISEKLKSLLFKYINILTGSRKNLGNLINSNYLLNMRKVSDEY